MNPHKFRLLANASIVSLALCVAVPAHAASRDAAGEPPSAVGAQQLPASPGATQPLADVQTAAGTPVTGGLADIVVTAQRRSENLQKVPIVITAISGPQLAVSGVTSLATLNTVAPGYNSRNVSGAFQPYLRGIGTSSNVVENPVALYIDGVYIAQQREGLRELPDIEQLAVLKGPQGTLFGRNATGGVIQITTRAPSKTLDIEGYAGIDNYATVRAGAFLSGPLADNIAASLSIDYAHQGNGYGTNRVTGDDTFQLLHSLSLRGKVRWELDGRTDVTIIGDYMDRRERAFTFVPYDGTTFVRPIGALSSKFDTYSQIDPFTAFKGGGASVEIDHDLEFAKLVSITSYRQGSTSYLFDDAPTPVPIFYVRVNPGNQPNHDFTQEIQLVSKNNSSFTYTAGVFYYNNRLANQVERDFFPSFYRATVGPPTVNQRTDTTGVEDTESVAPFGQVGIGLFTGTKLTLGARWTYEKRQLHDGLIVSTRYNGAVVNAPFTPPALTIRKPTWRIALDHQFGPDVLGYVSYNRGIKSGGFNILNPSNPAYLPERLDAYEAGIKTEVFDRRLRFNVGGFYYNYANLQITQFVGVTQSIVNGAKAELYGLDVDFNARLTSELSLSGGLEALHAKFTNYRNAVGSIVRPDGGATLISIDASGRRIPQAQNFVASLSGDYQREFNFGSLHYNLTGSYNGDYYIEADNFLRQPAYGLLSSSIAWTSPDKHYTVSLWGRNLLDERIIFNASSQGVGYPVSYGQAPRTYGLTFKVGFR
ncbi:TonB-dependent receptor [Sphingomonas sp. PAMC 26605]|uniref:TonB-dependent receptor n=1 Tax=Sphingomonas sp. PAMC 26605 TaxID=1112214 RepID=UPI0009DADC63|nr:TonB-dependent receptor [Sphingomonas sp. PAMC 26605]